MGYAGGHVCLLHTRSFTVLGQYRLTTFEMVKGILTDTENLREYLDHIACALMSQLTQLLQTFLEVIHPGNEYALLVETRLYDLPSSVEMNVEVIQ